VLGLELRRGARFQEESRLRLAVGDVLVEQLDRDALIEELVIGGDDDAHAAFTEDPLHAILAREQIPDFEERAPTMEVSRIATMRGPLRSGERRRHQTLA
jgi:hypothetical protein